MALHNSTSLRKSYLTIAVVLVSFIGHISAQQFPVAVSTLALNPVTSTGTFGRQGAGVLRGLASPETVKLTGSVRIGLNPTGGGLQWLWEYSSLATEPPVVNVTLSAAGTGQNLAEATATRPVIHLSDGAFTTDKFGNFTFRPRDFNVSFGRIQGSLFGNLVDNSAFTFVFPRYYQPLVTGQLVTDGVRLTIFATSTIQFNFRNFLETTGAPAGTLALAGTGGLNFLLNLEAFGPFPSPPAPIPAPHPSPISSVALPPYQGSPIGAPTLAPSPDV